MAVDSASVDRANKVFELFIFNVKEEFCRKNMGKWEKNALSLEE